jgi:hypothetical protein
MRLKLTPAIALAVVLVWTLGVGSCNKYAKTGELARDFAAGVLAFQQSEIVFHQQGKVSDNEHREIQEYLLQVAQAGKALDMAINKTHSAPDATTAMNASIAAVQTLLDKGVLNVKNDESQAALRASLLSLKTILDSISAIAGVKRG